MKVGEATQGSWILSIDFGTTSTVASAASDGEVPQVLELDGARSIPSIIVVDSDQIVVGRSAERLANTRPAQTLRTPKARIGDPSPVVLNGRAYPISSLIAVPLGWVYQRASEQFGSPPRQVRMTYPATFSGSKLSRLQEAADAAGIGEVFFVAEPIAATLWYSHLVELAPGSTVAVYDLGGGTLDIAVLRSSETDLRVMGRPLGDSSVGGELFDEIMFNIIGGQLPVETWEMIQTSSDESVQHLRVAIRTEATKCKEVLSKLPLVEAIIPLPSGMTAITISRDQFEKEFSTHVHDSIQLLKQCVLEAGVDPEALNEVQLVGGSSRIPAIEHALRNEFPGALIRRRGDQVTAVSLGAVIAPLEVTSVGPQRFGNSSEDRVAARSHASASPPKITGAANETLLLADVGDKTVVSVDNRTVLMPEDVKLTQARSASPRKFSTVVMSTAAILALLGGESLSHGAAATAPGQPQPTPPPPRRTPRRRRRPSPTTGCAAQPSATVRRLRSPI